MVAAIVREFQEKRSGGIYERELIFGEPAGTWQDRRPRFLGPASATRVDARMAIRFWPSAVPAGQSRGT